MRVDDVDIACLIAVQRDDFRRDLDRLAVLAKSVLKVRLSKGGEPVADTDRGVIQDLQRLARIRIGLREKQCVFFCLPRQSQGFRMFIQCRLKVGVDVQRLSPYEICCGGLPRRASVIEELSRYGRKAFGSRDIEALLVVGFKDILEQRLR